ncbi:DNA repair protein XRCC2 homolog isoform X2 [Nymphaea colorata]|uniref:DNA repair protein XRCC2 homolog isoform X2 n=1 Tax=Nymphaea colorata TaxID=210225 RepID=UPI00129E1E47|nr:DNA repair protein XRCC2 homolog isoform X2 [Nymphaea colorata]
MEVGQGNMGARHDAEGWIGVSETAQEMLGRTLIERPCLIAVPPLHRVPLRPGNVVELVGPSASAKSEILLQAAINCILPNVCNGVFFGGMQRLVMYFDLDCSFDVQRFSNSLKKRIADACGNSTFTFGGNQRLLEDLDPLAEQLHFNEDVYFSCMRRFSYIRCYNSYEFLASLKTIRRQMQKESEAHGVGVLYLMIDRNCLSFRSVTEAVIQEIRKLLDVLPVLVLATKATILGVGSSACENDRNTFQGASSGSINSNKSYGSHNRAGFDLYKEYMPLAWQALVTQQVLLQVKGDNIVRDEKSLPIYMSTWLLPVLNLSDMFVVEEAGISLLS